jgi:hypothetical protein
MAIYLPFSLYCIKQVILAINVLSQYYNIGFVEKCNLVKHLLWSGTATIDVEEMRGVLSKKISQEDINYIFIESDALGEMDYDEASNEDVLQVLNQIENFGNMQMICLTPLTTYNPLNYKTETKKDGETGGFVGLLPHKMGSMDCKCHCLVLDQEFQQCEVHLAPDARCSNSIH